MDWKKLGKALLFPHVIVLILLVPVATALLVCSMTLLGTESVLSYISYVLAAYTLTAWCVKIPDVIRFFKAFKSENKYAKRWWGDARLRVNVLLYSSLVWNVLYGALQLWLGVYHHTFWFGSFGVYYICLGIMRFLLARHTSQYAPGERMHSELIKYRACGIVFLVMNLALALIVFFMIYWNRSLPHHMITAIAMAAYTFTAFTVAIVNVVKYKKYSSPVFSASKAISLAAALVSMLTLESTMLTAFGNETMDAVTQKIMLGVTGGVILICIIIMAIHMIARASRQLKELEDIK